MDDPNEENVESSWVMINTPTVAEETIALNYNENLENSNIESDWSIISESKHPVEEDTRINRNENLEDSNMESGIESDWSNIISENSLLVEEAKTLDRNENFEDSNVESGTELDWSNIVSENSLLVEKAAMLNLNENLEDSNVASNIESDGSNIISESSHLAKEATTFNHNENFEDRHVESDTISDGSNNVICESSYMAEEATTLNRNENLKDHESNNEENIINDVCEKNYEDDAIQKQSINAPVSTERASQPKTELEVNLTYADLEPRSPIVSSNQFYLNRLQEPRQKIFEHQLGSRQPDLESGGIIIKKKRKEKKIRQKSFAKENCHNERLVSKHPSLIGEFSLGLKFLKDASVAYFRQYLKK